MIPGFLLPVFRKRKNRQLSADKSVIFELIRMTSRASNKRKAVVNLLDSVIQFRCIKLQLDSWIGQ